MNDAEIQTQKNIENLLETLRCPCGGIQVEERNCIAGYIQYKCCRCKRVEPYKDKLNRAIVLEIVREAKRG